MGSSAVQLPSQASKIPDASVANFKGSNGYTIMHDDSIGAHIADFFTGIRSKERYVYDEWKLANERAYEQAKLNDARQWDSMKYQVATQDLLKAGLNPWLAVQSGLSGAGQFTGANASTSSSSATSALKTDKGEKSNPISDLLTSALKILGILAIAKK